MFVFLWSGKTEKEKLYLANWDSISGPKAIGGWGLKNIFWFGNPLSLKIIWGVLARNGLWSRIIIYKYLINVLLLIGFKNALLVLFRLLVLLSGEVGCPPFHGYLSG
jgi:hypothetical protein